MIYKNYLGYKVFENGKVLKKDGNFLIPQYYNENYFFEVYINKKRKRISCAVFILMAFEIFPPKLKSKIFRKDGNKLNCSLSNINWI